MRPITIFFIILWVSLLPMIALAQSISPTANFPQDDDYMVLQFHAIPSQLAQLEGAEKITVFGSGRVVLELPHYMKQAGTHEFFISQREIQQLLRPVLNSHSLAFRQDNIRALQAKRLARLRAGGSTELTEISDADNSHYQLQFDSWSNPQTQTTTSFGSSSYAYINLRHHARQLPSAQALKGWAELEIGISSLVSQIRKNLGK